MQLRQFDCFVMLMLRGTHPDAISLQVTSRVLLRVRRHRKWDVLFSVKQQNGTLSSSEAENAAAVEATKELVWFRQLLQELGFPQLKPTLLFVDNASVISLTG
jgi:hypothetical protein